MRRGCASREINYFITNCKHCHTRVRTANPNAYVSLAASVKLVKRAKWNAGAYTRKGKPCLALHNYGQVDPLLPIFTTSQEKNLSSDFNINFSDVLILKTN